MIALHFLVWSIVTTSVAERPIFMNCFLCVCVLEQAVVISDEKKSVQKAVDSAILSKLDKLTASYLAARFTLSSGQYPHAIKF